MLITKVTVWDAMDDSPIATIKQVRDDVAVFWKIKLLQDNLSPDDTLKIHKAYEILTSYLNNDADFELKEKGLMI